MDLLKSVTHPQEALALLRFKFGVGTHNIPKLDTESMKPSAKKCYEYLNLTSRSFAVVIQALEGDLRHAVCIFYLVLRSLDTVEDDMTIPIEEKVLLLKTFYQKLEIPDWKYLKSQEKDKMVLEDFPVISEEYRGLAIHYRDIISDICMAMGKGMSEFLQREVETLKDWDLYCHYVAGLVGIGLSRLFSSSCLEDKIVGLETELSNSMGLFLQKTNIIRDYLEDSIDCREFWPEETWSKYANKLRDFQKPENRSSAVACLNELITNALNHVPAVLKYMGCLRNQSIFNFCAIPEVMAIATLAACYNNPDVFTGVVKIRRGQAVIMMMEATTFSNFKRIMHFYANEMYGRIPRDDPHCFKTKQICRTIMNITSPPPAAGTISLHLYRAAFIFLLIAIVYFFVLY